MRRAGFAAALGALLAVAVVAAATTATIRLSRSAAAESPSLQIAAAPQPVASGGVIPSGSVSASVAAPSAAAARPLAPVTVVGGSTAAELALAASRALHVKAPVAVLAPDGDAAAMSTATTAATERRAPLLLTPAAGSPDATAAAAVRDELVRLGTTTVVAVAGDEQALAPSLPDDVDLVTVDGADDVEVGPRADGTVVLVGTGPEWAAATATATAAGARVLPLVAPDPRASPDAIAVLSDPQTSSVLVVGDAFGDPALATQRVMVAETGAQLPGGGQLALPGRRYIALYGTPGYPSLGSLGEQPLDATIARAQQVAAEYQPHSAEPIVPTFELITTVAAGAPGADGDYSEELSVESLRPVVDAAAASGVYVVLDLQPGRTDFLTQAKRYESLLREPHVGLALDPEWRLGPDQRHLRQVGTVTAAEINTVTGWLAGVVRDNRLPQKLVVLHQFKTSMITERETLDLGHDELAVLVHVDGFGPPGAKIDTWNAMRAGAPEGLWWGWKNFYDEDTPTMTPQQTMAVQPAPWFVSYQ